MTKQSLIDRTLNALRQLPDDKAEEISDFVDFISKRYEEKMLSEGIQQITSESQAFEFLNDEEDLYSEADLKDVFDGQG